VYKSRSEGEGVLPTRKSAPMNLTGDLADKVPARVSLSQIKVAL